MNRESFQKLCSEFFEKESALLIEKRSEYAPDIDVLANFDSVASWLEMYPAEYCMVLIGKHLDSIRRAVKDPRKIVWEWNSDIGEGLKQRIADARNYLLLLAALIDERAQVTMRDSHET